jgi:DNA-binding IclR family transcriptional regulator
MLQDSLLRRLRAEFLEMPGLRLTLEQAQYRCGVERGLCQRMLDTLVEAKFLCVNQDGTYARPVDGDASRQQGGETPNIYLAAAELKALQDVFETAETVDWAAYERAKTRIRLARLETLHPHPAKAHPGTGQRFEKAG